MFMVVFFVVAGCYLSFPANKLVSGEHCKIVQDASSGLVWLEDVRYSNKWIDYTLHLFLPLQSTTATKYSAVRS